LRRQRDERQRRRRDREASVMRRCAWEIPEHQLYLQTSFSAKLSARPQAGQCCNARAAKGCIAPARPAPPFTATFGTPAPKALSKKPFSVL